MNCSMQKQLNKYLRLLAKKEAALKEARTPVMQEMLAKEIETMREFYEAIDEMIKQHYPTVQQMGGELVRAKRVLRAQHAMLEMQDNLPTWEEYKSTKATETMAALDGIKDHIEELARSNWDYVLKENHEREAWAKAQDWGQPTTAGIYYVKGAERFFFQYMVICRPKEGNMFEIVDKGKRFIYDSSTEKYEFSLFKHL